LSNDNTTHTLDSPKMLYIHSKEELEIPEGGTSNHHASNLRETIGGSSAIEG
jgi:hypothetical protein